MTKKNFSYIYIGREIKLFKKHVKIGDANYMKTEIREVNTNKIGI